MIMVLILSLILVISFMYKNEINSMFKRFTPEELEAYQESVILHMEDIHNKNMEELKLLSAKEKKEIADLILELKELIEDAKSNKDILEEYSDEIEMKINKYEEYRNAINS